MRLVIFGAPVTGFDADSDAVAWQALGRALSELGHRVVFFERRAIPDPRDEVGVAPWCTVHRYRSWEEAQPVALDELQHADAAMVTSRCPDGLPACLLVLGSPVRCRVFYDLDPAITLRRAGERGMSVSAKLGLADFDLVLSVAGGEALALIGAKHGAQKLAPLYPWVDRAAADDAAPLREYRADLACLWYGAARRERAMQELLFAPARRLSRCRFLIGGRAPSADVPATGNVEYVHVPAAESAAFLSSARLALHVTRGAMAPLGYCPSTELMLAAACGVPVLSDAWRGLEDFFMIGEEILVARTVDEVLLALTLPARELAAIGAAGRERVLASHTAPQRAQELVELLEAAARRQPRAPADRARDLLAVLRT